MMFTVMSVESCSGGGAAMFICYMKLKSGFRFVHVIIMYVLGMHPNGSSIGGVTSEI